MSKNDSRKQAAKKKPRAKGERRMRVRLVDCLLPPGHPHGGAK